MSGVTDVVVVGGGIGGASLAGALARAGLGVTVLEASAEFTDRVRGESMHAWGYREARELGVEQVLLDAGAHVAPLWKQYAGGSVVVEFPMSMMVPDIPGTLNLRHPVACQALLDAAASDGASVLRGVKDVKLAPGSSPSVSYSTNGHGEELRATLVVGADGRASTVRKQVGIKLERQEPIDYLAGLLVDGLDDVPDDHDVLAEQPDLFFVMFHQGGGRARVYLCVGVSDRHRFSGKEATQRFFEACRGPAYPWADEIAAGVAAGPCATYPGDDTWTEHPYADGVVLVGDAAGHNDPIIGQGLSIAFRDARLVRDLVLEGARDPAAFAPYGKERMARMEALRFAADIVAVTQAEDADNREARRALVGKLLNEGDVQLATVLTGAFTGPEHVPHDMIDPALLDRIRAA